MQVCPGVGWSRGQRRGAQSGAAGHRTDQKGHGDCRGAAEEGHGGEGEEEGGGGEEGEASQSAAGGRGEQERHQRGEDYG